MEITKAVKPFIRRGANTFGNIVYSDPSSNSLSATMVFDIKIDKRKSSLTEEDMFYYTKAKATM